jgi:hypothetical protein
MGTSTTTTLSWIFATGSDVAKTLAVKTLYGGWPMCLCAEKLTIKQDLMPDGAVCCLSI